MKEYVIFDTETTGLVKHHSVRLENQPRIIEFAAIRIAPNKARRTKGDNWKEIDRIEFKVNPGIAIDEEITKITGITQAEISKIKKTWGDYVAPVSKLFTGVDGVIAHNLSFDMALVNFDMKRADANWFWPSRRICTVEETVHLLGRRMRLGELHQHLFNEGFDGAHRAMNDVEALARCVIELAKKGVIEL